MKKVALAIFVKTPSLSPLKTRLAKTMGRKKAEEFYILSLNCLKETIATTHNIEGYFAVAEKNGLNHEQWQPFKTFQASGQNLGDVLHKAYTHLIQEYDTVMFIGSDSPQITDHILKEALTSLHQNNFVFGKAVDGGFYLFAGNKNIPKKIWTSIRYSCGTTLEKLSELLKGIGGVSYLQTTLTDVDEEQHLQDIMSEMPAQKTASQQKLIDWIKIC